MFSQQTHHDLARERQKAFLTQAADERRATSVAPTGVELRDGSRVVIRPVRSIDAGLLLDGFRRLGARSRRLRFLGPKHELSADEVRFLTDVDHHDHEALAALSTRDHAGVGIARFVRAVDDPRAAEIAVTVVDDWQGRGLGTVLLDRLVERANEEGVDRFRAVVSADNPAMSHLLGRLGAGPDQVRRDRDTLTYEITLPSIDHTRGEAR